MFQIFQEALNAYEKFVEFTSELLNPKTAYNLTAEEINEFFSKTLQGFLKIWSISFEYWTDVYLKMIAGDPDKVLAIHLRYISEFEDTVSEMVNNAVWAAYVNAIDKIYRRYLLLVQNITSAMLHSIGAPSRRDVVALAEAYVDLKGDIKKEVRAVRSEIENIKKLISEIKEGRK